MSDTQAKATPSKAARDLSREIADLLAVPATDANRLGLPELLQKSLSDLLEKAQAVVAAHDPKHPGSVESRLKSALEPWKAGE